MKFTLLKCAMFLFGILLNIPMSVFSQRTLYIPVGFITALIWIVLKKSISKGITLDRRLESDD